MNNTNIAESLSKAQKGKTRQLPHLVIAIDPGASSIKVVGSVVGDEKCYPFIIEPYCLEITDPTPNLDFDHNSVWVTVGGISYALGNLAIAQYDCPLEIKELKIKSIVPKICAAIAVLHRKFKLPAKFELSISSVLPPGEFGYGSDLKSMLTVALRKIITPAGVIKPVLQVVDIHPEGLGVMNWHRQPEKMAHSRDIGVIMLGFRNTSVLFSRKGQFTKPKSSKYGFHTVLEKISATSGGSYPEADLIVPVWKYLIDGDESGFKRVATSNFDLEMSKIRPAIEAAMLEYRRSLETWLKSAMQQTDVIVLCGGNADYIRKSLNPFLEQYIAELPSGYPIFRHIGTNSIPEEINATGIANRFLDIYCIWHKLNSSYSDLETEKDLVTTE
jgi:hypothetical protein